MEKQNFIIRKMQPLKDGYDLRLGLQCNKCKKIIASGSCGNQPGYYHLLNTLNTEAMKHKERRHF